MYNEKIEKIYICFKSHNNKLQEALQQCKPECNMQC